MIQALLILLGWWCAGLAPVFAKEVVIGVFAYQGEQAADFDWSPVLKHLNTVLPAQRFRLSHFDADGLRSAIAQGSVDLVITNPGYDVAMEYEFGLSRIATLNSPQALSPAKAIGSVVIVRADRRDLKTLSDLAGKRLAAVAPQAFGGYLLVARELLRQGIDPASDLQEIRFMGLPMTQIIEAVQSGAVDAGVVRACLPEQLASQGALRMADVRVLSPRREAGFACALSTPLYPDWPIAVTRSTDRTLAKQVAQALLNMPAAERSESLVTAIESIRRTLAARRHFALPAKAVPSVASAGCGSQAAIIAPHA